jgi:hypothetical protein
MLLNNAATSFTHFLPWPALPVMRRRPGYRGMQTRIHPLIISPQGKALCLLKTQFAKKPKNPV